MTRRRQAKAPTPPCIVPKDGHCDGCGKELTGRQRRWCSRQCQRGYVANHRWTQAKAAVKAAATWYLCARCGEYTQKPEVNHIVPCNGKHSQWGCHHHLDNLEVLCRPCHLAATRQQRKEGLL